MNLRIIITYKYEYIPDSYGYIRMHTERYLSTYLSIPSVTFRYGQTPSDTHLVCSLAYETVQYDVSNHCLLSKCRHTSIYGCHGHCGQVFVSYLYTAVAVRVVSTGSVESAPRF